MEEKRDAALHSLSEIIVNWLEEIVADLADPALAGPAFAQNALEIMTLPDDVSDPSLGKEHPATLIRPHIHLKMLEYLDNEDTFSTGNHSLPPVA